MAEKTRPSKEQFLTDPRFEADRDLMRALMEDELTKRFQASAEKVKAKKPAENIFDKIFMGIAGVETDGDEDDGPLSFFDRLAGK